MPAIREWPASARPRERLLADGVARLTSEELLALLIGSGRPGRDALALARDALRDIGGLRGVASADASTLARLVGPATAARITAACEIGRRAASADAEGELLDTPARAARVLAPRLANLDREALIVALLTRRQRLMAISHEYRGNLVGTSVRVGELFAEAVRRSAAAIVLAHNHPSGDPEPSADDIRTTNDAIAAGRLLGIAVIDHLVIGSARRWVSLRERGVRF
ncbi:MAG TPA: DNA repair protein RadC [Candidatus Limnocylindria bacterium]|nr:DNA repair protein RadC [Candidatus Limnocylindria bacterium]